MSIDEKTYFALKKNIEQFGPESFVAIRDLVSSDKRTLLSIIQLLSTISMPNSLLQYQPLIKLLLEHEETVDDVFRIISARENLTLENIIIFNHIIQGDVYQRILKLNNKSAFYNAIKIVFENCKNDDRRFLVIDDESSSMLKTIQTFSKIFTPLVENDIYIVNAISERAYFDEFVNNEQDSDKQKLYNLWFSSFNCRENLFGIAMGILHGEYESLKSVYSDAGDNKSFAYYSNYTTGLLREFYDSFKEKNNYEKLDEITSFCLIYFNLEQNAFLRQDRRDLIAANDDIYYVLIEFLMLNPEANLDLIVYEHKKRRFQDAWKFSIPYNGVESSGGGLSQSGNVFTLHDVPIVERILTPFFIRLYKEDCEKLRDDNRFIKIIENRILTELKTSARNPVYLRRAVIPSLLLGLLSQSPDKKSIYKEWLVSAISNKEGLPHCSSVVFSHLMRLSNDIKKFPENFDHVFDLIVEDLKLYERELPTNVFTIQVILLLIRNKYVKAERLFLKLLENPDYIKYDDWDYHTLSNLGNYDDYGHSFILKIIKFFISNKDWLSAGRGRNVNEVIPYLVELYLKSEDEAKEVRKEIVKLVKAEAKTEVLGNLCANFLRSLAEKDPEEASSILQDVLGGKKPWEVFKYGRDSLVSIADYIIEKSASVYNEEEKKALLDKANRIIEQFIDDPNPSTEENGQGYNYHTKILNNEDTSIITTVRGHVCWSIQKLCLYDYSLKKAWEYTNKLLKDKNLYVVYQALVPFIEVVKRRNKLLGSDQVAIDATIEYCLDNYAQYNSLANHLGIVCSYYRDVNESIATKMVDKLQNSDSFGFFMVYFAYFREDAFNSDKFKSLVIDAIKKEEKPEIVEKIFHQLVMTIDENIDYLPRIIDPLNKYEHNTILDKSVLHSVYRIVNVILGKDKNKKYYNTVLDIYKKYLKIESEFIEATISSGERKEIGRFFIGYSHEEILQNLHDISISDYYTCATEIIELALRWDLYFNHLSIAQTLSKEREMKFVPRAIELLARLTAIDPKYYELKSQLESLS